MFILLGRLQPYCLIHPFSDILLLLFNLCINKRNFETGSAHKKWRNNRNSRFLPFGSGIAEFQKIKLIDEHNKCSNLSKQSWYSVQ